MIPGFFPQKCDRHKGVLDFKSCRICHEKQREGIKSTNKFTNVTKLTSHSTIEKKRQKIVTFVQERNKEKANLRKSNFLSQNTN